MPETDLTSFLASRYLVADEKLSKKRKRKDKSGGKNAAESLLIQDDDELGWSSTGRQRGEDEDDDGDNGPKIFGVGGNGYGGSGTIAGMSAEFRKTKKSNWTVVGGSDDSSTKNASADTEADAIIAAAAAETQAALAAQDEAPIIDAESSSTGNPVLMSDGTHAGLQSAATVTAQLERRRREEREQYERERQEKRERRKRRREEQGGGGGGDDPDDRSEGEEEVVYRDATGRRVDVALRRHEARQAIAAAEQKERDAKEALLGDVQREQARQRREELADAALLPLARGADDEEMNRELKAQSRWNDPMAAFLKPAATTSAAAVDGSSKGMASRTARPVYRGPAAPNRYGIRPGYRWDGVDRSIGFEAERFKTINRKERNRDLEYQWQMDV